MSYKDVEKIIGIIWKCDLPLDVGPTVFGLVETLGARTTVPFLGARLALATLAFLEGAGDGDMYRRCSAISSGTSPNRFECSNGNALDSFLILVNRAGARWRSHASLTEIRPTHFSS